MRTGLSVARLALPLALALIAPPPAAAQRVSSPINELLTHAKDALNDLKYAQADTIARDVLALGSQLRRSQAILAWQIAAAARFPEEGVRDTSGAREAFRSAIRLDLDATLPVDMAWSGLAALLNDEKRTAIGIAVRVPRSETIYGGSVGDAILRVASAQPADVWLLARAADAGTEVVLDSATDARDAALRIRSLRGRVPVLTSGAYEFVVRARDKKTGAVMERTMQASVTATALDLVPAAPPLDSSKLLPEIEKMNRPLGIVAGLIVGGMTVALNQSLRADPPIRTSSTDSRATAVGVGIALGTIVGVMVDRGDVIKKNRDANEKLKRDAAQRIADSAAENERRTTGYRAKITLLLEDK